MDEKERPVFCIYNPDLEGEKASRLVGFNPERLGRWGVLLPSGEEAKPGIGLRRNGNTYLFDVKRGFRVIHHRWSPEGRTLKLVPNLYP